MFMISTYSSRSRAFRVSVYKIFARKASGPLMHRVNVAEN